jgi:hypothetical protein
MQSAKCKAQNAKCGAEAEWGRGRKAECKVQKAKRKVGDEEGR